jgi:release factor glutamine methyltransferase
VFAEDEALLLSAQAADPGELERLVTRRVGGEPLEQVLGWVEFDGHRFAVEPGVFVPRRRTELMVRTAVAAWRARDVPRPPIVVDLCCGCGAVGAAVVHRLGANRLVSADVEPAAVRCAVRNVEPVGGEVLRGDLFAPLPTDLCGRIDLLTANVPYVPTEAIALMPPEARNHEPRSALDGGSDGLRLFARVAAGAAEWLTPGGSVFLETSESQVPAAVGIVRRAGLDPFVINDDDLDATVVRGERRPSASTPEALHTLLEPAPRDDDWRGS